MFFTLTNLQALIINADDFCDRPDLLSNIIASVDVSLKLVLVSRIYTDKKTNSTLDTQIIIPTEFSEHLHFDLLLKRTAGELKTPPASTVFLCASTYALETAKSLLLGTVVLIKDPLNDLEKHLLYQESPDFVVESLEELLNCLSIRDRGYAAEFSATPQLQSTRRDTTSSSGKRNKATSRLVKLPNLEFADCPYFVLGRYFGPSDPRHELHALSLRIWNFKRHLAPHADLFSDLFLRGIKASTCGAYDLITQVPSRPEVGDRLKHCLSLMEAKSSSHDQPNQCTSNLNQLEDSEPNQIISEDYERKSIQLSHSESGRIQPDVLRCVKSYPSLKGLNLQARKSNIANVFRVQKDVLNKRIVIIDDIITTGATMNACIAELKSAGAASVTALCLAHHPYAIKPRANLPILCCTECGEKLRTVFEPSQIYFRCPRINHQVPDSLHSSITFHDALKIRIATDY